MNQDESRPCFDLDRLRASPQVATLEYRATIGSTNDRALELLRAAAIAPPLLILTGQQTAGRGRGNNRWWFGSGALAFSYVVRPPATLDRSHWPRWTLVAAVAVCDVIEQLAPSLRPGIRWPNDVHVAGKKISGILVEAPAPTANAEQLLVLGLGFNVNNSLADAPEAIRAVGTSLADLTRHESQASFDLTDTLLRLLKQLEVHTGRLAAGDPGLVRRWQELCVLRGRRVGLRLGDRDVTGQCLGIADDGALLLDTATGCERFYAGVLTSVG